MVYKWQQTLPLKNTWSECVCVAGVRAWSLSVVMFEKLLPLWCHFLGDQGRPTPAICPVTSVSKPKTKQQKPLGFWGFCLVWFLLKNVFVFILFVWMSCLPACLCALCGAWEAKWVLCPLKWRYGGLGRSKSFPEALTYRRNKVGRASNGLETGPWERFGCWFWELNSSHPEGYSYLPSPPSDTLRQLVCPAQHCLIHLLLCSAWQTFTPSHFSPKPHTRHSTSCEACLT